MDKEFKKFMGGKKDEIIVDLSPFEEKKSPEKENIIISGVSEYH